MRNGIQALLSFVLFACSATCCSERSYEDKASDVAFSFATAFYNWDFPAASKYASEGSQKWLCYLASQVDTADIAALREKEKAAEVEILSVNLKGNSDASVTVAIHNFLSMDSIGRRPVCQASDTVDIEVNGFKVECSHLGL